MNCKQGDLAFITLGIAKDRIVVCSKFLGDIKVTTSSGNIIDGKNIWEIEPILIGKFKGTCVADNILRPIRDQPGEDETFQWAGKPVTTENKETNHVN